jgi:alkaline phosphatase D
VSNNYAGDVGQADIDQPVSEARRISAYQAFYEHLPIRLSPVPERFDQVRVHRSFRVGDLATLFVIETRQHADVPACRTDGSLVADEGPGCDEMEDEARSNLGAEQEQWLAEGLGASDTRWNVIANPIMLAGLNVGTVEEPELTRDAWVGYPAARRRLLDAVRDGDVSNPVVVTGDWHASFVLDVEDEPGGEVVMPEFLASSISTVAFADDYRDANPHVRYFHAEHGYGVVTLTADELRCEFRYVEDVWDPDTPIARTDSWLLPAGSVTPEPA